jgi:tRNA wybutosine-synthesizing protein 1
MNEQLKKILEKQRYGIVGNHSAVKLCHWMRQSLLFNRHCYKQSFYGIQSHRCLQMTPAINQCNHNCLFCWRFQNFTEKELQMYDEPEDILEQSIEKQRILLTGFKGDVRCDRKKWDEANNPNMLACSLSGEPTLYPKLSEFFELCHKKNITTFLVTNGTTPQVLQKLDTLPTQLYVSVVAPNKAVYQKVCSPLLTDGWEKIQQTLELLPSLNTRTVIRHTLIHGWNMGDDYVKQYARLVEKADPLYIEPKGYVFVGYSRRRMNLSNMPSFEQVNHFGDALAKELGYYVLDEQKESRVVLLSKNDKKNKISG